MHSIVGGMFGRKTFDLNDPNPTDLTHLLSAEWSGRRQTADEMRTTVNHVLQEAMRAATLLKERVEAPLRKEPLMQGTDVTDVPRHRLCTGCGTCAGVCPANAVTMAYATRNRTYTPCIDRGLCTGCVLCRQVCPGIRMALRGSPPRASPEVLPPGFGKYIKAYVGHAADNGIRHRASSGGVATALSAHLLKFGAADAVVASAMRTGCASSEARLETPGEPDDQE